MLAEMLGGAALGPNPTLAEWLERWLAVIAPSVRASTLVFYRQRCRRLIGALGHWRLRDLRPSHVEEALLALPLAPWTVRGLRSVLRSALGLAVRDGIVSQNAAALARLPAATHRRQPPTTDEVRALIAALDGHRLRSLVVLLAATGLRVGEALGLRWADIDLDAGRLTVRHQLVRERTGEGDQPYILTPPKTSTARRVVLLAPVAVEALRARRRAAAEELFRPPHDLVFTNRKGGPLAPSSVGRILTDACARAKIRQITPHDLRRYAATIVAATGDLLAAQALLGHTSPKLTSERYAAPTEAALRRAAQAAEEALR